jgi:ferrochelatase
MSYDAVLVYSFGGPEGPDEVMPFLERVTHGRGVPRERLEAVAEHYHHFGGVSPIGERTRELVRALRAELSTHGPPLPVYVGHRFSAPFVGDALREMQRDGVRRALAFVTSAFSSYSGCRAYQEDLAKARAELGDNAPEVDKIRAFYDHPGYIETCAERLRDALALLPDPARAHVFFSAHSIPMSMATTSAYVGQLEAFAGWLAEDLGLARWRVVYQSRSGPPEVPWLEPDVCDALRELAAVEPGAAVVVAPFGFVADHMEVVWDLDEEARVEAERLGLKFVRATSANTHPRFVGMARELIEERTGGGTLRASRAPGGARPDRCAPDCCPAPRRPR